MSYLSFGQLNCHIQLVDSYSLENIQINESLEIERAYFQVDSLNNLILLEKKKGQKLNIHFQDYELYSEKIKIRNYKNDTINIYLTPISSVIMSRFDSIWKSDFINLDTLIFEETKDIQRLLTHYLTYLEVLQHECFNGMCNYSNTHSYIITFSKNDSIFEITEIETLTHREYHCEELENCIDRLQYIYPKFRIDQLDEDIYTFTLNFRIIF
ncbi:hypothetical protein [Brumimicrobium mesophilum]|uniref:hypothetical protein n=1 Tax=Brumimicrobium mesophilum TaxID=392717 RepID=UPI00131A76EF|nr:hypothetical protein [Brumimicrobium mesophilum]